MYDQHRMFVESRAVAQAMATNVRLRKTSIEELATENWLWWTQRNISRVSKNKVLHTTTLRGRTQEQQLTNAKISSACSLHRDIQSYLDLTQDKCNHFPLHKDHQWILFNATLESLGRKRVETIRDEISI